MTTEILDSELDGPAWARRHGWVGTPRERHPTVRVPRWTSDPPTTPGWWFNRPKGKPGQCVPLFVFDRAGYLFALEPTGRRYRDVRTMFQDEWSDHAIVEPTEP